ncbi:unnamed protein product [Clavelina lepadiformis]|uniref:Uncharacterized protein n=1 Tax=Clavelina lepadiformis TaxID=159417 RepID=A0ABP0GS73_CLALP
MLTLNFKGAFTPNPNPPIKWSNFARFDRSLSPNPEDLETGIVFILYRRVQFHHGELVQTPFPTILSLNFKGAFTPNPNPSFKWSHFARCDRSLSPYPEDLETDRREKLHDEQLFHTHIPTVLNLKFKSDFTPNPDPPIKWSHFARCDRSLSPYPEYLETGIVFSLYCREQFHHRKLVPTPFPTMLTLNFKGAFTPNPNPPIKWSHFARFDRSLSPNPEDLETGIVFILYRRVQFHHGELVQTPFTTILTLIFKIDFTHNLNPSIKWSHFARFERSLSPNLEYLETGAVTPNPHPSIKWRHFARCDRSLSSTPEDLITGAFTPNPNHSIKWSHFARCDRLLSPNPEDLETDRREKLHDEQLFHTHIPTVLNLKFKSDFTPNPDPPIKWSHFARCDRSLSPNLEYLETGIVFNLYGREQFHHRELVQTPFPTMLTLNFKSAFTPNPNPPIKWSHFARCDRSLSPYPEYLETGIVFSLYGREQFHHRKLVQTPFPTMLTLNFKGAFTPNPNPPIKWSNFARFDRSLSPNPEDLETGIVFILYRRVQFHHGELVQTPFPTILSLNFKGAFTPNPNPSFKWSHFARCDRSLSPYPEDLETGIVFNLFGREQFHHRELVQTPFPTMLTLNFKGLSPLTLTTQLNGVILPDATGAFTPNPNHSIKWSHFARCDRLLSPNPEDLETGILFILYRRVQFHHRELVPTPFPTMLTLNFKGAFTPNPNPPIKWSHFARCDRSLSPNPENLETGIVFMLYGREQFHHRELFSTPFPTMLTLNFKGAFTPNPNSPIKWSHFARCDRSLSSTPEDSETGAVTPNPHPSIKWRHFARCDRSLSSTPEDSITGAFSPNPNHSIKWSHFARCDRLLSPNPEDLETGAVTPNLHHSIKWIHFARCDRSLSSTPEDSITGAFTPNPNHSIKWSHFARCDRLLSPNPEDLETDRREKLHDEQLFHTHIPTVLNLKFKSDFTPNPDPPIKWSHFARCDRSLSPNLEYLETGIVFNLYGREQFHHRELVQTPFPTMLTLNFKGAFTPNPNPPIKWSHFARFDRSLSPNPEDLETGIVFILYRRVQFHHGELVQTPFTTILTLISKIDFTHNLNPSIKWSHFARCDRSLSPNPEYLETSIVFNLLGREQFHHGEIVETPFPTMLTFNFKIDFTPNPNPSIKWSHFDRFDRKQFHHGELVQTPFPTMLTLNFKGLSPLTLTHQLNGDILPDATDRRVQFQHGELVPTPFPTMLTLNFKSDLTPNPNPSIKWSHFDRFDRSLSPNPEELETGAFTPNPNPSFKWSHIARCDRSLRPYPEDLETGAVTPNPHPSIKWRHFARCDRSLSSTPEDSITGIVFILDLRVQFHHGELVQTPFSTMLTLNFKGLSSLTLTTQLNGVILPDATDRREKLHDEQLFHTHIPTVLNLKFKSDFTPNPDPPIKWSHFSRCDRSLSPNLEYLETGIVFNLYGREQFHHRELVQTPFPTMLTLNFKSAFTPNPNPPIKWSHFA